MNIYTLSAHLIIWSYLASFIFLIIIIIVKIIKFNNTRRRRLLSRLETLEEILISVECKMDFINEELKNKDLNK